MKQFKELLVLQTVFWLPHLTFFPHSEHLDKRKIFNRKKKMGKKFSSDANQHCEGRTLLFSVQYLTLSWQHYPTEMCYFSLLQA